MRLLLSISLACAVLLAEEEPAGKAKAPPTPAELEFGEPATPIEDKAVAKQEVARFEEKMKQAADAEARTAALRRLGKWDHPEVLKAASKYLSDKETPVAVAAVVVCARQAGSKSKAGNALWRAYGREERVEVGCALLVGLGFAGCDRRNVYQAVEKVFRRDTTETHKAATRYFGYIRA